jgi:hypothetical protein
VGEHSNVVTYLDLLAKQFDGQHLISVQQAAKPLGIKPGTAANRLSLGTFPLPVVRDGGRARVRLIDLARYLAGEYVSASKKRGRPRKAEQIARRAAGGGE